jgi:flavodoxin
MSKVLVVYFSRTGYTEKVAERVAERCGADVEAIREPRGRLGVLAYIRSAREALKRKPAEILPLLHDLKDYEVVLFGTPVWASHVSSPMRACLDTHRRSLRRVAFFCTQGSSGAEKVLEEMAGICGKRPETTLVLNASEIRQGGFEPKLDRFIDALELPAAAGNISPDRQLDVVR